MRNVTELQLPALDTEQRKKAKGQGDRDRQGCAQVKKLAEEYPVKCESYGFGSERNSKFGPYAGLSEADCISSRTSQKNLLAA